MSQKTRRRTIGRLAAECDVHVETIRYYERRGLIARPPAERGGRHYGDEALWRMRYIRQAQSWGWPLSIVGDLLSRAEGSPNFCAAIRDVAARRVAEIDAELERLRAQRVELARFVRECAAKPDGERCPVFRRLNGEVDPDDDPDQVAQAARRVPSSGRTKAERRRK